MIIDFRYHMASLIAVFLALGLGIVIGSSIVGGELFEKIVKEQRVWIERLEQDYLAMKGDMDKLRFEVKNKEEEIAFYQQFITDLRPHLINNQLQGKKIVVFEMYDTGYQQEVIEVLAQAGAEVAGTMSLTYSGEQLETFFSDSYLEEVANFLVKGQRSSFIASLVEQQLLKNDHWIDNPIDGIVFLNPPSVDAKVFQEMQLPILEVLRSNYPLWVVEKSGLNSNLAQIRALPDVSTVDSFETIPGQIALVLSLKGPKGHYGLNGDSQSIIPIWIEKE